MADFKTNVNIHVNIHKYTFGMLSKLVVVSNFRLLLEIDNLQKNK